MKIQFLAGILCFFFTACSEKSNSQNTKISQDSTHSIKDYEKKNTLDSIIHTQGTTIQTRFSPPKGFNRIPVEKDSYAEYLRTLPLKPNGSLVKKYDGSIKYNHGVYLAVVDLEIGNKDLHQCADAVMRLRAEYLWNNKEYDKIHFNFTNGFRVDYSEYMKGKRMVVNGNKTFWKQSSVASNTYKDFWNYMELIFTYAGTLSLSKELISVELDSMQIGDVFIIGGSPGHAVSVVDMAVNPTTGEKVFMLSQSYMPAQEIQILSNNDGTNSSPWYPLDFGKVLFTLEWSFMYSHLKRFKKE